MGWCRLSDTVTHPILTQIGDQEFFYFLHSYALPVDANTIASARHAESFSAIACRDNFVAAQFHPERSSNAGSRLLRNFLSSDT
jgi:glutamine amidotransferase